MAIGSHYGHVLTKIAGILIWKDLQVELEDEGGRLSELFSPVHQGKLIQ